MPRNKNNINRPRPDGSEPLPKKRGRPIKQSPIAPSTDSELVRESVPKSTPDNDVEIFNTLYKQIEEGENLRGPWNQKMDYYYRMRMRMRKEKTFPFPGCYSKDTNVLTKNGWLPVGEIVKGDELLTMDTASGKSTYKKVTGTIKRFEESLIRVKSNSVDFLVTDDHKMIVKTQMDDSLKFVEAKDLNTAHKIPLTSTWEGKSPEYTFGFDSKDFMRFLGWYISEGFTYESGTIGICQSLVNESKRQLIKELLDRMSLDFSERDESFLVHCNKLPLELRNQLVLLGKSHEKYIPRFVMEYSSELLEAMLETMIMGDGCVHLHEGYSPGFSYYTSSKRLSEDVQEVAQKIGMRARVTVLDKVGVLVGGGETGINPGVIRHLQYCVSILSRKFSKVSRCEITREAYNDFVYCFEVPPFNSVYVERNGIAAWAGNCSNLRLPTIEKYIRKIKASLFNVVWGIKPHAMVIPEPTANPESGWKLETYLDWLLENKIRFPKKLSIVTDKMLEKGFCIIEPIWKISDERRTFEINLADIPQDILIQIFSVVDDESLIEAIAKLFSVDMSESVRYENTESLREALQKLRSGARTVKLTLADETYNNVDLNVHDPENVYVPVDATINPQEARFVAYEFFEPWNVVKQKAARGIYNKSVIDTMEAYGSIKLKDFVPSEGNSSLNNNFRTSQITEDMREGISRMNNPSHNVKLWRVYAWYDLDGDGIEERNVFILAPEWKKTMTSFPFTYAHKKWPCIRFDSEVTTDRWYSPRGVPEMLEDIDKEINAQHNQKIDQQTIRNTPMFAFRSGIINPRLVKFIPGQGIPVNGMTPLNDAISVLNNTNSNAEFSYRDEEMLLKSEIQELYGQVDYSLQSQINRREPRTASEANQAAQSANLVFSLDATIFGESISELFTQIIQLTQQYLQDSVYFQVVGEGQTVRLTREEIQGQFQIRVRGNDTNTNGARRLELAQAKIAMLANPYAIQSGMYTPVNHYFAMKEYLQETGDVNWDKKISIPQPPPPPMPPPAIENIKTNFVDLAPTEKAQVLTSAGIKPDVQAHIMDKQLEVVSEMSEPKPSKNGASSGKTN